MAMGSFKRETLTGVGGEVRAGDVSKSVVSDSQGNSAPHGILVGGGIEPQVSAAHVSDSSPEIFTPHDGGATTTVKLKYHNGDKLIELRKPFTFHDGDLSSSVGRVTAEMKSRARVISDNVDDVTHVEGMFSRTTETPEGTVKVEVRVHFVPKRDPQKYRS